MNINFKNLTKIFLALITFLIIIFYIFAKGINIVILPNKASVNANLTIEEGIGFKLSNRFIFFPGNKKVLIESPGFYDQQLAFSVDALSDTYTVELSKLPGKITFNLIPIIDSDIYIDEKLVTSQSSLYLIDAGQHSLEIKNPLYITHKSEISILGMNEEEDLFIELIPNWAAVEFNSFPGGAGVYLSDHYLGDTPLKKNIVAGLHEIIYKKNGYVDLITIEEIVTGISRVIDTVNLSLLPAMLSIDSDPTKARVLINNSFAGLTPINSKLAPNKKNIISVELDGYKKAQKSIILESNNNSTLQFNLEPVLGKISIDSNLPADIYVDGDFLQVTPYHGTLQAIKQEISIQKQGYRTYINTIKPTIEFETTISAFLITEEKARLKESPDKYTTKGKNQMVLLEPGLIEMGARRSQIGQRANETIRRVNLTKPFYLSIHEVTNSQFSLYTQKYSMNNGVTTENLPVVNISWNDAALYCNWLSQKEGLSNFYQVTNTKVTGFNIASEGYRMPTEAEWSWAARSIKSKQGKYLVFPWGDSMPVPDGAGNFADESAKGTSQSYIPNYSDGFSSLASVGSFNPNDKGIYDLGGNVSEYVNDFYSIMIDSKVTYTDLIGPLKGRGHVAKGSNWKSSSVTELRYSYRDESSVGDDATGFRIARWLIGKDNES